LKQFVIDTNVLISFVTDRNPEQQVMAAELLHWAAGLKAAILCHQNVLTEFVYVLDRIYDAPKNKIREILADFIHMPEVEIIHDIDFSKVLACWPEHIPDFGDAVLATVGMTHKKSLIATFDLQFKKKLAALGLQCHEFG